MTKAPARIELLPVEAGDPHRFLPAVLQRMEA